MLNTSLTPEPSMDEILRKVQQSIAGDNPGTPAADGAPRSAEILSLSDAGSDNGRGPAPYPVRATPEPEPPKTPQSVEPVRPTGVTGQRLLSEATASAAVAAFAQLAAVQRAKQRAAEFPLGSSAPRTLEDLVRELMRPILEGWLNEKLPEIIERIMRAELARVLNDVAT
jgi:cell pole-organizing protein PopZ